MTAAQIQARVDAWLAARPDRPAGDRAAILASQWRHVCVVFGPVSSPALGVLLGLVREAWRLPGLTTERDDRGQWSCRTRLCHLPTPIVWFASEAEALVLALESAP